jgi:hypothetical protein
VAIKKDRFTKRGIGYRIDREKLVKGERKRWIRTDLKVLP